MELVKHAGFQTGFLWKEAVSFTTFQDLKRFKPKVKKKKKDLLFPLGTVDLENSQSYTSDVEIMANVGYVLEYHHLFIQSCTIL